MVYTIVVHLYTKEDPSSIEAVKAKLVEASSIYSKDKETLSWFVMQDDTDPRRFCIVERYAKESVRRDIFLLSKSHQLTIPIESEISSRGMVPRVKD
jgi:hypothetical protein